MTGAEITGAIIGSVLLCAIIVYIISIMAILLIWWIFGKDLNFENIANLEGADND